MDVGHVIRKDSSMSSDTETKGVSFVKQFYFSKKLSDEKENLWLSSDSHFLTFPGFEDPPSPDVVDFDLLDISFTNRFSSALSCSGSYNVHTDSGEDHNFSSADDSSVCSREERRVKLDGKVSVLDHTTLQSKETFKLLDTKEDYRKDPSIACSDRGLFADEESFSENASISSGSWTPFAAQHEHFHSDDQYLDRTNSWIPLLNLEDEDSEWTSDKELDVFGCGFPSPSHSPLPSILTKTSKSGFHLPSQELPEVKTPLDSVFEEPIFWPFDDNSYLCPDFERTFFSVSPPRSIGVKSRKKSANQESRPIRPQVYGKHVKDESRRKLELNAELTPLLTVKKSNSGYFSSSDLHIKTPFKSEKSTRVSYDLSLLNNSILTKNLHSKAGNFRPTSNGKDMSIRTSPAFEANEHRISAPDEAPIERMVGLNEFDGHEGILEDLGEDWFSLEGSAC